MVKNQQFKEVQDMLRVQKRLEISIFYTSLSTFPKKRYLLLCVKHFICLRLFISKNTPKARSVIAGSIWTKPDEPKCKAGCIIMMRPKCYGSIYNS